MPWGRWLLRAVGGSGTWLLSVTFSSPCPAAYLFQNSMARRTRSSRAWHFVLSGVRREADTRAVALATGARGWGYDSDGQVGWCSGGSATTQGKSFLSPDSPHLPRVCVTEELVPAGRNGQNQKRLKTYRPSSESSPGFFLSRDLNMCLNWTSPPVRLTGWLVEGVGLLQTVKLQVSQVSLN